MASDPSFEPRSALRSKVLVGFGMVLLMLVIIATISVQSTRGFIRTAEWVTNAHEAIEAEERILRNLGEIESVWRTFLFTGDERLRRSYEKERQEIQHSLVALRSLVFPETPQQATLRQVEDRFGEYFQWQQGYMVRREQEGAGAVAGLLRAADAESPARGIRQLVNEAQNRERDVLAYRADLTERIARSTVYAVVAGSLLTIVALIIACLLILRDLTARRRAEEALAQEHNLLSSIINAMPNHVYVKDGKGRFILDNSAHRLALGVEESHSVEGRTVFDYYTQEQAAKFDADDRQVIGTGAALLGQEEPTMTLHGEQREVWLETNKVPLRDTDGKIVGLVGISSDISARKESEEKLRHFAEQLERSNTELQNFASVASHDLQEPLRKIQAFGDRLEKKCGAALGEQGRDYLARMQNAAQRMQVLIQDLLKLSRITSRAQPFERCDLAEIVRQVLSDLEIAVEQMQARVEVGPLPMIQADPLQMRQLFQNLIANALKFQRPGERPLVNVTGRISEGQERVCQIRVSDNGIGFEEKFAEQIFVVFQRLHAREEYAGTGIGLAVCRKITDRHGGSIVAKSAPGEGATFLVTLPVQQPIAPVHE